MPSVDQFCEARASHMWSESGEVERGKARAERQVGGAMKRDGGVAAARRFPGRDSEG